MRLEFFQADELKCAGMRGLKIDRRRAAVIERGFPAGNAHAPFVARFQTGKSPFRPRRHQIVPVENGKIEKLARDLHAYRVQTDVVRTGAAVAVPVKSGYRVTATTFQFSSENV